MFSSCEFMITHLQHQNLRLLRTCNLITFSNCCEVVKECDIKKKEVFSRCPCDCYLSLTLTENPHSTKK